MMPHYKYITAPDGQPIERTVRGYAPCYYAENGLLMGHDARDVHNWLAAHPGYDGWIWFDNGDGGDQVEVSEVFAPEEVTIELGQVA